MSSSPPLVVADRYRLVAPLGQGGMGRVWRATDVVLHRDVAIKELVPPPGLTPGERQEMRERSLREARAIARLNNVNVVRVFDVLRTDADPWIVMEYVASRSLQDTLASDGPFNPVRTAEIGLGVLGALRAAHRAGVVHRDVKPGNVLLGADGRVVLTDFGLATVPGDPNVTRTGLVLGSPAYIAPERARDGTAGPAADLWSLGATLYAAVEGASPFARPSAIATLAALATENPPPARNAGPLKPVLNGLLRKDPTHRINAEEAERLLLRATGRRSRLTFPMSPTMRRPGVGRERPALPGPSVARAAAAPVVPGPRPPVPPARPADPPGPAPVPGGRPPVFAPGKASVGRPAAETPTRTDGPKVDAPRLDATRVDAPPVRDERPQRLFGTRQGPSTAPAPGQSSRSGTPEQAHGGTSRTERGERGGLTAADVAANRRKKAAPEHEKSLAEAAAAAAVKRPVADATTVVKHGSPPAAAADVKRLVADATTVVPPGVDKSRHKPAAVPPAVADATTAISAPPAADAPFAAQTAPAAEALLVAEASSVADAPSVVEAARTAEAPAADVSDAPTAVEAPAVDVSDAPTAVEAPAAADRTAATSQATADAPAQPETSDSAVEAATPARPTQEAKEPAKADQPAADAPVTAMRSDAPASAEPTAEKATAQAATVKDETAAPEVAAESAEGAFAAEPPGTAAKDPASTGEDAGAGKNAGAQPAKTEPDVAQPSRTESSRTESSRTESSRTESSRTESSKAQPSQAQPSKAQLKKAEPKAAQPGDARPPTTSAAAGPAEPRVSVPLARTAPAAEGHVAKAAPAPTAEPAEQSDDLAPLPGINRPARPAWTPMQARGPVRKAGGVTLFGTRLTYRQAAVGGGVLLLVLLLVVVLAVKAFGGGGAKPAATKTTKPVVPTAAVTTTPAAHPSSVATTQPSVQPSSAPSSEPPSSAVPSTGGNVVLPAGWHWYTAPPAGGTPGFTIPIWDGATMSGSDGHGIKFRKGNRLLLVDRTGQPQPDAYQDLVNKEANQSYRGYHRIRLERIDYARNAGEWEFNYVTDAGNLQHVIRRNFVVNDNEAYMLSWYVSPDDWDASKSDWQLIYQGFQAN